MCPADLHTSIHYIFCILPFNTIVPSFTNYVSSHLHSLIPYSFCTMAFKTSVPYLNRKPYQWHKPMDRDHAPWPTMYIKSVYHSAYNCLIVFHFLTTHNIHELCGPSPPQFNPLHVFTMAFNTTAPSFTAQHLPMKWIKTGVMRRTPTLHILSV